MSAPLFPSEKIDSFAPRRSASRRGRSKGPKWYLLEGPGPEGATCGGCRFLTSTGNAKKYHKCGQQRITHGDATTIRVKDPACRLYGKRT